ncbi:YihY/virulence factor BrkB family protein [Shimia sp. Alg240-R146]|uniref:YihY/virulence factor BrkB family protein n=1 Tax=Shimia sp. Alg240-R146 TaxID=2993449 RepID=UPI0022E6EB4A|nr:YihY/virulence factor BrkB family protein [Shimia sp. Alg240-R146]
MQFFFQILGEAFDQFQRKGGFVRSSHLALSFMFALFPFCIFALSLAAVFSRAADVDMLIDFVLGYWPPEIVSPIERELRAVLQSGAGSLTFGALLSIVFATNGVDAVRVVVTEAYRDTDPRPFWHVRLLALVFVVVGTVMILSAGMLSVGVPLALLYFEDLVPWLTQSILSNDQFRSAITIGLLLFFLYACHRWLPGVKHHFRDVAPGVVLTVALWIGASQGFAFYISNFSTYSVTYAGLAGIMSVLVFLYVMSAIFVFGAEFNGRLMAHRGAEARS